MDDLRIWAEKHNHLTDYAFTQFLLGNRTFEECARNALERVLASSETNVQLAAEGIEQVLRDITDENGSAGTVTDAALQKLEGVLDLLQDRFADAPSCNTPSGTHGILPDHEIATLARAGMIDPFEPSQVSKRDGQRVLSSGVSSYGYDARVSDEFKVFTNVNTTVLDPKNFDERSFVDVRATDGYVIIPPNSFVLGRTVERFKIPRDVLVVCVGKSTLARLGVIVNVTPLEPCLSEDSEILTDHGWVRMADVKVGDLVLTRRNDGVAEYQPVERKQQREHTGEMLHFGGRSVDQLVTPEHKVFAWHRNTRSNTYKGGTVEAKAIFGKYGYSFDRTVNWGPSETTVSETVDINGLSYPTDAFLKFLGCYLGDGSAYHGSDGGYSIKLAVVSKVEKRETFRSVLKDMGIEAREHERGFHFYSKPLATYLMQFGHARDKYLDPRWKGLPPDKLRLILDGLMASDGCNLTNTYTTSSRRLADDVQEIAFKSGSAAIVRQVESTIKGQKVSGFKVRICGVHMMPKMPPKNHKIVKYDGPVYDVTVPNHVFFSRRNGKASWTGNCWEGYVTLEFSNTTPLPAKLYANEGACQFIFLRSASPCATSYADRKGKYQGQTGVTPPRMVK